MKSKKKIITALVIILFVIVGYTVYHKLYIDNGQYISYDKGTDLSIYPFGVKSTITYPQIEVKNKENHNPQ